MQTDKWRQQRSGFESVRRDAAQALRARSQFVLRGARAHTLKRGRCQHRETHTRNVDEVLKVFQLCVLFALLASLRCLWILRRVWLCVAKYAHRMCVWMSARLKTHKHVAPHSFVYFGGIAQQLIGLKLSTAASVQALTNARTRRHMLPILFTHWIRSIISQYSVYAISMIHSTLGGSRARIRTHFYDTHSFAVVSRQSHEKTKTDDCTE